ncbi:hypothetical protein BpHYR1_015776 [Brachionus plicatilis]|uniref:Uncharacterized protein n=1 Tax=Brachionus plicatilis TaxID=10195 RepID=A0A3M7PCD6_BRAPC|nr:hypothetical protein BpHYR1_015776 [Brachionus plicatilis]
MSIEIRLTITVIVTCHKTGIRVSDLCERCEYVDGGITQTESTPKTTSRQESAQTSTSKRQGRTPTQIQATQSTQFNRYFVESLKIVKLTKGQIMEYKITGNN